MWVFQFVLFRSIHRKIQQVANSRLNVRAATIPFSWTGGNLRPAHPPTWKHNNTTWRHTSAPTTNSIITNLCVYTRRDVCACTFFALIISHVHKVGTTSMYDVSLWQCMFTVLYFYIIFKNDYFYYQSLKTYRTYY